MITGNVNIDKAIRSLQQIEVRFVRNMESAVAHTSAALMRRIVQRTEAPAPPPPVQYYQRTKRLVSGWAPAGEFVGVTVPGPTPEAEAGYEGTVEWISDEKRITFRAANHVPYVADVEFTGTWATPWPSRRPGYFIVHNAVEDTVNDFVENLKIGWNSL